MGRAVVEMRALAVKNHLQKLTQSGKVGRLLMTGGAANNQEIRKAFADTFQVAVRTIDNAEGAAFGAAVRAVHAFGSKDPEAILSKLVESSVVQAEPADVADAVSAAAATYDLLEAHASKGRGRM